MKKQVKHHLVKINLGVLGLATLLFLLYSFVPVLLHQDDLRSSTKIYDRHGVLLYEMLSPTTSSLEKISFATIPKYTKDALVAAEDKNFYTHWGVDFGALGRATSQNLSEGEVVSGASTLTTQLVKMKYFPTAQRTFFQKAREGIVAMAYSLFQSKEQVMEEHLNRAYFGNLNYGIAAASHHYFGKSYTELAPHEAVFLIGLLPAPESYDPYRYFERAKVRQKEILRRMEVLDMISSQQEEEWSVAPLHLEDNTRKIQAPHFVQYVIAELKKTYPDVEEGGYEIETTLDSYWQKDAEEVIQKNLATLRKQHVTNGSMVVMDPSTGAIRVMVGSKDYFAQDIDGQYNVALAKRQPGSSLKPFTYLTAFLQGWYPADVVFDIEKAFSTPTGLYRPKNYDLKYHGPVSLREALGSSLNIPAVTILEEVGYDAFYDTLARFGITFKEEPEYYGPAITLGGGEVRLLDLTHAYAELANGGYTLPNHFIKSINFDGKIIFQEEGSKGTHFFAEDEVFGRDVVYLLSNVLRDDNARIISFGARSRLFINDQVAVKTGTTKDFRDNWAFGFTPDIAVGVWVGNNDNSPMEGVTGITGAIPIWHDFMRRRSDLIDEVIIDQPDSIVQVEVCRISGYLASSLCPENVIELFRKGEEPIDQDHTYQEFEIDAETQLLADDTCQEHVVKKVFPQFSSELIAWAQSVHMELPPMKTCSGEPRYPGEPTYTIMQPLEGEEYHLKRDVPVSAHKIPLKVYGIGEFDQSIILNGNEQRLSYSLPFTELLPVQEGENVLQVDDMKIIFDVVLD